eukprot:3045174-Amphidinium_carterae.1
MWEAKREMTVRRTWRGAGSGKRTNTQPVKEQAQPERKPIILQEVRQETESEEQCHAESDGKRSRKCQRRAYPPGKKPREDVVSRKLSDSSPTFGIHLFSEVSRCSEKSFHLIWRSDAEHGWISSGSH